MADPFSPSRKSSPPHKQRNITPFKQYETPNPQTPYKSPKYIQPRPLSSNNSPLKSLANLSKKPVNHDFINFQTLSPNPPRNITSSLDKYNKYETVMECFLHEASENPVYSSTEAIIQAELQSTHVFFWQDIPSLQLLYCHKLKKPIPHTKGIIGQAFITREMVNITNATKNPSYIPEIDGTHHITLPQIYFPLYDYSNTVCAVVQVFKKEGFNDTDQLFIQYFVKKFKVYSHWLDCVEIPPNVFYDLMQIMELEQFLLLFQKKVTNLFHCETAEIWKFDKKRNENFQFKRICQKVKSGECGIAGESFKKNILINSEKSRIRSSYHEPIDGRDDVPVLVFPIANIDKDITYAIILRGKTDEPIFTLQDENLLKKISFYLIISFCNVLKFTERSYDNRQNQLDHLCIENLCTIIDMLNENKSETEVFDCAMEKLENLTSSDRSSLFIYDKSTELLNSIYQNGLKNPVSISIEKGIVGITFRESKLVNVPDVYEDPLFDATIDLESGYRTHSMLSIPIKTDNFKTVGVIQLLNRLDTKPYSKQDVNYAKIFSNLIGFIIKSTKQKKRLKEKSDQVKLFTEEGEIAQGQTSIKNKLKDILQHVKQTINCEYYSVFIVDQVLSQLNTYIVDGPKLPPTLPLATGIAATTVTSSNHPILIVNDAYHDPRFNKIPDLNNGFKTKSILAVPVFSSVGEVIAVVELINKKIGGFSVEDANILKTICVIIGQLIELQKQSNVIKYGVAELEMQKYIGEIERKVFVIPKKLQINSSNSIESREFFAIEWNGIGLFKVAFYIFNSFDLLQQFHIPNDQFFIFLFKIKTKYNDIPYHNWIHAIDVLQYSFYQIKKSKFDNILTKLELLGIFIASISHNTNHEGFTNPYHQTAQTPIGILYKDLSINEMNHCAMTIEVFNQIETNIFHAIPDNDLKRIWSLIIQLILSTDMALHFKILKNANDIMDQGPVNLSNPKHRFMTMSLILKIADISNVSRPFYIAENWCDVLDDEVWRQQLVEKENGWIAGDHSDDRSMMKKAKNQVEFYTYVCLPLFTALARILPELQVNAEAVNDNLHIWKQRVEELEQTLIDQDKMNIK